MKVANNAKHFVWLFKQIGCMPTFFLFYIVFHLFLPHVMLYVWLYIAYFPTDKAMIALVALDMCMSNKT